MDIKQYREKNKMTWLELANKIGISQRMLYKIAEKKSPNTTVWICQKIKKATGLEPYEYLNNLENLKKIKTK